MNKYVAAIAGAAILSGGVLAFGATSVVHAQSTTPPTTQTASTTNHKTTHKVRHIRLQARLNQAVRDGTITTAQKTALLTELKTLRSQAKSDLGSSPTKTQSQQEHATIKSQLEAWANTNNFPLSKLFPKLAN